MRSSVAKEILGILWTVGGAVLIILSSIMHLSEMAMLSGLIALLGGNILFYLPTQGTPAEETSEDKPKRDGK
jgi:hypothetical protein